MMGIWGRLLMVAVMSLWGWGIKAGGLEVGDAAPGFALPDQGGQVHRLEDYRGRWLVLYFYPKDDTPGCTTEACAFRDDIFRLQRLGVALLGVSLDDADSHRAFAARYHLPFPLLSDTEGKVAEAYGALFHFGPLRFAKRQTFIIGPNGHIAQAYRDVSPKTHSGQVLQELHRLGVRGGAGG
jgi:thioredoxin-dependent peroxiredoxin